MEYISQYVSWTDPWTYVVSYVLFMAFIGIPSLRHMWRNEEAVTRHERKEAYFIAVGSVILAPIVVPIYWVIFRLLFTGGLWLGPFLAELVLPESVWHPNRRKKK